jgi:hypothetical protein
MKRMYGTRREGGSNGKMLIKTQGRSLYSFIFSASYEDDQITKVRWAGLVACMEERLNKITVRLSTANIELGMKGVKGMILKVTLKL